MIDNKKAETRRRQPELVISTSILPPFGAKFKTFRLIRKVLSGNSAISTKNRNYFSNYYLSQALRAAINSVSGENVRASLGSLNRMLKCLLIVTSNNTSLNQCVGFHPTALYMTTIN